jgi:hypothetical protein
LDFPTDSQQVSAIDWQELFLLVGDIFYLGDRDHFFTGRVVAYGQ